MSEIRTGAILNYILVALQIGIPLLLTPFIMGALEPAEYGVYMLAGTIMVRLYMSDLGRTTTTRFLSEYYGRNDDDGAAAFLGSLVMIYSIIGLCIFIIGLVVYPWLEVIFPKFTPKEMGTYRILYLMTLFNAAIMFPARSLMGVADARQKFTVPGLIAVIGSAVNALGTVTLLVLGVGAVGLIALSICTGILALFFNLLYCFVWLNAKICFRSRSMTICRGIFVFSFWMFLNQLINMLNAGTGNYIVAMTQGAAAAGIYTNGLQIYGHYYVLSGVLTALFLPRVVHMVTRGASPMEQTEAMVKLGRIQLMISGCVLAIIVFFGAEFFRLWVGHIEGADANLSFHIALCLVIPQTFALVQALGWQISQARDVLKERVLITGFNSLLFIVVSYFVCLYWGIAAQAVWAAASILIQLAMLNLIHYRGLGLRVGYFYRKTFQGAFVAALVLCAVCFFINLLLPGGTVSWLLIKIALFLLCYPFICMKLYATEQERKLLPWSARQR